MKSTEEKLKIKKTEYEKIIREYRELQWKHERETELPRAKKLVGTIWKYRNNYSCPEGPDDYWYIFTRILRISSRGHFITQRMQVDKYGEINIRTESVAPWAPYLDSRHEKATLAEWNAELRRHKKSLAKFELSKS